MRPRRDERSKFGVGAWDGFTGRTVKADKAGRFTITGALPGQQYRLRAGVNPGKRGGEVYNRQSDLIVKPGETKDLGDLNAEK